MVSNLNKGERCAPIGEGGRGGGMGGKCVGGISELKNVLFEL